MLDKEEKTAFFGRRLHKTARLRCARRKIHAKQAGQSGDRQGGESCGIKCTSDRNLWKSCHFNPVTVQEIYETVEAENEFYCWMKATDWLN